NPSGPPCGWCRCTIGKNLRIEGLRPFHLPWQTLLSLKIQKLRPDRDGESLRGTTLIDRLGSAAHFDPLTAGLRHGSSPAAPGWVQGALRTGFAPAAGSLGRRVPPVGPFIAFPICTYTLSGWGADVNAAALWPRSRERGRGFESERSEKMKKR